MLLPRRSLHDLLVAELKACSSLGNLERGRCIHALAIRTGDVSNVCISNTLIHMYARCGSMKDARNVFDGMQTRTTVSWNTLMFGYANDGKSEMALDLFSRMPCSELDATVFLAALKACSSFNVTAGKALHLLASSTGWDSSVYVENTLVHMYAKLGNMHESLRMFQAMRTRTTVSWNALLLGYADKGEGETVLRLFGHEGCSPDDRTFVAALKACTVHAAVKHQRLLNEGKAIHTLASSGGFDSDAFVLNSLLDMYSTCGSMENACEVFEQIQHRDVIAWTTLIMGHADNGLAHTALNLFSSMAHEGCAPDEITFVAALKACTLSDGGMEAGRALHLLASGCGCDAYINVRNALLDMYVKCGRMNDALNVFSSMLHRDVVSWTVLMQGYVEKGEGSMALELFVRMKRDGCQPDALTFAAVLKACGSLGALEYGRTVHAEISARGGYADDFVLTSCLVDFYAKCGNLVEAEKLFDARASKDLVTWNALITGYSRHGDTRAVFRLFERMQQGSSGLLPDAVTFLSVLMACSHAGLVDKGKQCFEVMTRKHSLNAAAGHYACMTDILGRANKLDEAMVFLRSMPFTWDLVPWMTILGACRKWKNVKLGRLAFETLTSVDEKRFVGAYYLMANLYGSVGLWEDRARVHGMRAKLKVSKKPGQSWWTNRAGVVHKFSVGDPQSPEIHEKLQEMVCRMREQGYVADLNSVTRNMSDEDKEDALCGHSEKLAIACALLNTQAGETIQIIKNIRVCDDCHTATALISKLERRTILCRDANRFHVFKDGTCSCGDFW